MNQSDDVEVTFKAAEAEFRRKQAAGSWSSWKESSEAPSLCLQAGAELVQQVIEAEATRMMNAGEPVRKIEKHLDLVRKETLQHAWALINKFESFTVLTRFGSPPERFVNLVDDLLSRTMDVLDCYEGGGDWRTRMRALASPESEQPSQPQRAAAENTGNGNLKGRRVAVDAYIDEVYKQTGKRITRTDIWKAARYRSRTEFERWERCDRRATRAANERFTRILTEKPHLK